MSSGRQVKMSPLQLTLILHTLFSYISLITTLPITSKPLENTPEHLTWEAWLMVDSKNPSEHEKSRKITPKSIFITPNFTNNSQICPHGYKMDHRGQCIQVVNINAADILASRLESLLPSVSNDDEDIYDYDNYDTDPQPGPLQLNIPLNINFEPNAPDSFKSDVYYDDEYNTKDVVENQHKVKPFLQENDVKTATEATSRTTKSTTSFENAHAATSSDNTLKVIPLSKTDDSKTIPTNLDILETENAAPIETTTEIVSPTEPITTSLEIETTTILNAIDEIPEETHQTINETTITSLFDSNNNNNNNNQDTEEKIEIDGVNKQQQNEKTDDTNILIDGKASSTSTSTTTTKTTMQQNNDDFKLELQNESFLLDLNNETDISTTTELDLYTDDAVDDNEEKITTMDIIVVADELTTRTTDVEITTDSSVVIEKNEEKMVIPDETSSTIQDQETTTKPVLTDSTPLASTINRIIVVPEKPSTRQPSTDGPIIIITPQQMPKFTPSPPSSSSVVPTTTEKPLISEYTNLKIENESHTDQRLRETMIKHEEKESAIENIDTSNRFIYHHLGMNESPTPTAMPSTTTTILQSSSNPEYLDNYQIQNRIRFPASQMGESNNNHNKRNHIISSDVVRFPGPTSQRTVSNTNKLIPETQTTTTTTQQLETNKPFWWLPPGWKMDATDNRNVVLRFWARQHSPPSGLLLAPKHPPSSPSHHWRSSTVVNRENSKLPTENLYREITSQDVYRVLESRNNNYRNR